MVGAMLKIYFGQGSAFTPLEADMAKPMLIPTSTHWGNFDVETRNGRVVAIHPAKHDTQPSPIGQSLLASQDAGCRIPRPCTRAGYLKRPGRSDGTKRGVEPFVAVPWDEALDIAAAALRRVVAEHGNEAIFGGSYGWASAGRFHHSQSQLHRFLNQLGGYTYSVQSYSTGTAQVIIPHVLGVAALQLMNEAPTIEDVLEHTRLVVSFGGISMKNTQINQGGHRRPFRAQPPSALARRWYRGGLHQPGAGRRRRFSRCRLVADPPQCRCRADAGSGAHAAQRGSAR